MHLTFQHLLDTAPSSVRNLINELKQLRERPDYHPEESAFVHVQIVTDRLSLTGDPDLILTGFLHDMHKWTCVRLNEKNGFPTSPGHDKEAAKTIRSNSEIQNWIVSLGGNVENVANLCEQHMRVKEISVMRSKKQQDLRNMPIFDKLLIFDRADDMLNEFTL